jgi:citrate synthase
VTYPFRTGPKEPSLMSDTITIVDNRTGNSFELPIQNSTIKAIDLRKIKVDPDEFGMMTYDPGYDNTAACKSANHLYRRR